MAPVAASHTDLTAFWAALAGAGVGGIATYLGSLSLGRRELRRTARITLYLQLLPEIRTSTHGWHSPGGSSDRESWEIVADIRRNALLAGRKVEALAEPLCDSWTAAVGAWARDKAAMEENSTAARRADEVLDRYLASKIL